MIKLVFSEVAAAMNGRAVDEMPNCSVAGVTTDSRQVAPGELFFAIRGERFDGHDFVHDALAAGAVGAVVAHERWADLAAPLGDGRSGRLIGVDDPIAALGRLAQFHRRQLSAEVIGVVGSNGKTTTKAMIDHVLSGKLTGRCSPKSFNNEIGVPLTLLSATAADDYLVVEIGTNAPGEIKRLAGLAEPDMAVVTCISEEHLERLGDLAGVAREELSVLAHLREGGFAAVNCDSPHTRELACAPGVTLVKFGTDEQADLRVTASAYASPLLRFTLNNRFNYSLRMPGPHNALNAAAAVAVARRFGQSHEEIAARLESFVPPPMRGEVLRCGALTIINDAYNANPDSARAAIEMLAGLPCVGRRIAVFGEMRELGPGAPGLHRQIAERLRDTAAHVLLVGRAGEWMADALAPNGDLFGPRVDCCATVEDCRNLLLDLVQAGDVVLLKASRAIGLERLVDALRQRLCAGAAAG